MKKSKDNTQNCVITLPLRIAGWQAGQLNRDFRIGCDIYNALRRKCLNRYNQMVRTREYKELMERRPKEKGPEMKVWTKVRTDIVRRYRLSEYDFYNDVSSFNLHYKGNISNDLCRKIAQNLWRAFAKVIFGNGDKVSFCKYDQFNSLEGKVNTSGIVYKDGAIRYGRKLYMTIPVGVDGKDSYQQEMLTKHVKYCRIIRRWVKTKWKYYVQLVLEGTAAIKVDAATGELKHSMGCGTVGLDIGTQTIAVVADDCAKLAVLAPHVQKIEHELWLINRAMDRSRRATNPQYFNEDGTIIKLPTVNGHRQRRRWNVSNHYKKLAARRRDLYRKLAAIRKLDHEIMANEIMSHGNQFIVEDMSFKGLQRRAKKTEVSEKTGKYKRKKRFGKSIGNRAPAMLLSILDRKLKAMGGKLIKVSPFETKASQFNHESGEYHKKKLSQRMNIMPDGHHVQRDLYSAFLLKNIKNTFDGFNVELCEKTYPHFLEMHDVEMERIKATETVGSMGVA